MGAYLTGSAIGRHLMVPQISAKKTWEGFFGALGFALACSLALFKLMPGHLSMLSWAHATVLGLLLGFAAVIGDLAESIIKRSAKANQCDVRWADRRRVRGRSNGQRFSDR